MLLALAASIAVALQPHVLEAQTATERLSDLIARAPISTDTVSLQQRLQFGALAEDLLLALRDSGGVVRHFRPAPDPEDQSAMVAYYSDRMYWLGELEDAFAATVPLVRVSVTSEPSSVRVAYWRVSQGPTSQSSITTDDTLAVPPAWYMFVARHPRTEIPDTIRVACTTSCKVRFPFR